LELKFSLISTKSSFCLFPGDARVASETHNDGRMDELLEIAVTLSSSQQIGSFLRTGE
jgi:hypothetical protein